MAHEGTPLLLEWSLLEQPQVAAIVRSDTSLAQAANRGLDADSLREQLGRLGNTAYVLQQLELEVQGPAICSRLVAQSAATSSSRLLAEQQVKGKPTAVHEPGAVLADVLADTARLQADRRSTSQSHLPSTALVPRSSNSTCSSVRRSSWRQR